MLEARLASTPATSLRLNFNVAEFAANATAWPAAPRQNFKYAKDLRYTRAGRECLTARRQKPI